MLLNAQMHDDTGTVHRKLVRRPAQIETGADVGKHSSKLNLAKRKFKKIVGGNCCICVI